VAPAAAGYYSDTPTYGVPASADYSYGAAAPSAPGNTAHIRLIVPAGAEVWFGGTATRQAGPVRDFESPELTPGKDYAYGVTARWTEGGEEMTRTLRVSVRANSSVSVDFVRR
jgi:uncharacterized protein (TIGR03000 family)